MTTRSPGYPYTLSGAQLAMRRCTRSALHAHVMRTYRPHLQESTFRSLPATQAPATWPEVRGMLDAPTPTPAER